MVEYTYDAWGNCSVASSTTDYAIADVNPIRYRGYYLDKETGWYFLNARYYSPEWRRFISPDDTYYLNPKNVNGCNLYSYCINNPIMYVDPMGTEAVENYYREETDLDSQQWISGAGFGGGVLPLGTSTSQSGGNASTNNPLENITYTSKVNNQISTGDYHGFPYIVDNYGAYGTISDFKGGDGKTYTKLTIYGSYNGKDGCFEYIFDSFYICNHRFFNTRR